MLCDEIGIGIGIAIVGLFGSRGVVVELLLFLGGKMYYIISSEEHSSELGFQRRTRVSWMDGWMNECLDG